MSSYLPWYIGLRYTRSKRRNGFIAFVSMFALLGMMLGVFALIVVMSVMNGFDSELKGRILRVVPHAFVTQDPGIENWPAALQRILLLEEVQGSAPFIEGKALVGHAGTVKGIEVQGVSPRYEPNVSEIASSMALGELDDLMAGEYGIVLGSAAARSLRVSIGDKVSLTLPVMSVTPAGIFPRTKRFRVVGIFEVGAQVDQQLALIHIEDAQILFRRGENVDGLRLRFDDIYSASAKLETVLASLGAEFDGKDWSQTQGGLFQAVKMEKIVVGVMLSVIVAIAAFNIVTSLIMMVAEKRSDIAVLRTLGMSRATIVKIFMVQGTAMGLAGIVVGALAGVAVAQYMPSIMQFLETTLGFEMFDKDVFYVAYLPSEWRLNDTLITCGFAVLVAVVATIYPAFRASKIEPAEALRYDI